MFRGLTLNQICERCEKMNEDEIRKAYFTLTKEAQEIEKLIKAGKLEEVDALGILNDIAQTREIVKLYR